jgi:hypothetical protein
MAWTATLAAVTAAAMATVGAALAALLLASCASTPQPQARAVPSSPGVPLDATYDWHVLMTAPFGSVLKEVPGNLHEVLQFRDEAHSEPPAGDTECYGAATAPRFMESMPDEYLLCFAHDRLSRIEATVRLGAQRAADLFAGACALWASSASLAQPTQPAHPTHPAPPQSSRSESLAPASSAPAPASAPLPSTVASLGGACQGTDGSISYRASLEAAPEESDVLLTIKLEPGDLSGNQTGDKPPAQSGNQD